MWAVLGENKEKYCNFGQHWKLRHVQENEGKLEKIQKSLGNFEKIRKNLKKSGKNQVNPKILGKLANIWGNLEKFGDIWTKVILIYEFKKLRNQKIKIFVDQNQNCYQILMMKCAQKLR